MAALTRERQPDRLGEEVYRYDHDVGANVKIWGGAIVAINAAGFLVPATAATGLKVVGIAESTVDNLGGANGAKRAAYRPGCFLMANSTSGDLIGPADRENDCYVVDDQTVAKTDGTGTRSLAGRIQEVTSAGVFVHLRRR